MATYTWDAIYDRLRVDQGGLPNKSTQDMLDTFWTLAGYPDGTLGADEKVAFYESQGAIGDSLGDLEYDYWYRIGPNILAAKGAVFAIDAAQSVNGEQWALNRGSGGQMLRAKYGSVARAEIRNGVGLVLPGTVGNRGEVADQASLEIGGDLDIRVQVALDAWTGANVDLCGKWTVASNFGYGLSLLTTGELRLYWSTTGSDYPFATSTVATGVANGAAKWVRATIDVDNGASGRDIKFYLSDDGVTWTQLGSTVTQAGVTSIYTSGTSFFAVGVGSGVGVPSAGRFMRTQVLNGIGGTTVLDIDFTAQADLTSSFVASTGQTVTVTAANAVDTNDPLWLPWNGENYVHFPGTATANNATSSVSFTASDTLLRIEIDAEFDFASAGYKPVLDIRSGANATALVYIQDQSYVLRVSQSGANRFCTIASGIAVAARKRIAWEANMTAGTAKLYIHNGAAWVQFGTDQAFTAGAFGWPNVDLLTLGGSVVGSLNAYSAKIINNGVSVVDIDFTRNSNHSSFVCTTGQTVTFGRNASGRKTAVVTRPIWLFGTDDYMEVADNDLLDLDDTSGLSAVIVMRQHGTQANFGQYLCKLSAGAVGPGWVLQHDGTASGQAYAAVSDGTNTVTTQAHTGAYTPGNLTVLTFTQDETTDRLNFYNNNVPSGTDLSTFAVGAGGNTSPLRIGAASPTAAFYADMEVLAVGIFRRALSATEIAQIVTYYGAS